MLVYLAELDPRLLREVGCVKDRGTASLSHNEGYDFLYNKETELSKLTKIRISS